MTIEEKAKAYDEAREKIAIRFGSNVADEIFSQFEMSEDERIRKELLSFCQNRADKYPNDPKYSNIGNWIAWLEKQGKENPLKYTLGDVLDDLKFGLDPSPKQGEQKPVECKLDSKIQGVISEHNIIFEQIVERYRNSNPFKTLIANLQNWWDNTRRHLNVINEQKPVEWEDETNRKKTIDVIWAYANAPHCGINFKVANELECWLKSLCHQPKQEWSEEDKVKINRIVACLENLNVADNDILLKDVDWLKSLRPQNTWKPSDEQMEALFEAHKQMSADYHMPLLSLYNDLKKLREE